MTLLNMIESIFVQMKKTVEWIGWNISVTIIKAIERNYKRNQ